MFWVWVALVIIVWGIGGGIGLGNPAGGCAGCKTLDAWWNGLSPMMKAWKFGYYLFRKADCALRC